MGAPSGPSVGGMTVCALVFSISLSASTCRQSILLSEMITVCVTPVTHTLPTKRNFLFLMRTKLQMAFEQEPPERPRESREVLCGSATLHCAAAFLAKVSVDHRPCDISHQIAPQTLSQGPATLPQAGTSPHSWCLHHFKTFQFLCPHWSLYP